MIYIYRVGENTVKATALKPLASSHIKNLNQWMELTVGSFSISFDIFSIFYCAVWSCRWSHKLSLSISHSLSLCSLSQYRIHSTQLMIACSRTTSSLCNKLNCLQFPLVVIVIVTKFICLLPENCASWRFQGPLTNMGEIFAFTEWFSRIWQARRVSPDSSLSLYLIAIMGRAIKLPKCSITQRKQQKQQEA